MSELIQWPRAKYWDKAWNPIIGCKKCSPACKHCYAEAMMERFGYLDEDGFPTFCPQETRQKRPPRSGVVFVGNMTDLFGDWLDEHPFTGPNTFPDPISTFISETLYEGRHRFHATYLWLTKRVKRMCRALHEGWVDVERQLWKLDDFMRTPRSAGCMDNQYWGFTAENQEWYDRRKWDWRGDVPDWANGWLSAEPLLGPIDLGLRYIAPEDQPFKWVVVGCESGPHRRPCKVEWVEGIVEQCMSAGVPVFVKQLDIGGKCVTDIERFPEHLRVRQVPWAGKEVEA